MIRKATYEDIPALMEIFENARGIMRASGNMNQWNDSYPSEETVRKDISEGVCMVRCEEERIIATMAFIPGPDPTYAEIHDGEWADDCPYHVIHRIAVHEPGHGAARKLFDWVSPRQGRSESTHTKTMSSCTISSGNMVSSTAESYFWQTATRGRHIS